MSADRAYRPEIDGLRTIAVLSVIFYHAGFQFFSGGYVGVDIFFVISGYLITKIIAREMMEGRFSFAAFYERRIRRILPALFFVSAVTSLAAWTWLSPEQLKDYGQSLFATMAFAANLFFYLQSGYFSPEVHTLPLIHMWSLAVEEQFYLIFPILLLVLFRFGRPTINCIVTFLLLTSLFCSLWFQSTLPTANFFLTPLRAWELLTGSLLALNGRPAIEFFRHRRQLSNLIEMLGLALILIPIATYDDTITFPGVAAIPPVLGTAILIASDTPGSFVRLILVFKPMVAIGLISYSAYLWHQPLFAFVQIANETAPTLLTKILLIILTLLLAWISWRFVEQPFRNKGRFTRRQMFTFALTGSLLFAGTGAMMHLGRGFPERFNAATLQLAVTMAPQPNRNSCHTEGKDFRQPPDACVFGGPSTRWAVLGDSHGVELAYALGEQLKSDGIGTVQLTFSGCPPAYRMTTHNPGCADWTRKATDWIASKPDISDVVLIYRHNFHLFGDQLQTYPSLPNSVPLFADGVSANAAREAYVASLDAQIEAFRAAGKTVHVIAPVPELPVHVERYVFTHAAPPAFGSTIDWHQQRSAWIRARLDVLAKRESVDLVDPALSLCPDRFCRWRDGKEVLYFDDNHLSVAGARRLARLILATAPED